MGTAAGDRSRRIGRSSVSLSTLGETTQNQVHRHSSAEQRQIECRLIIAGHTGGDVVMAAAAAAQQLRRSMREPPPPREPQRHAGRSVRRGGSFASGAANPSVSSARRPHKLGWNAKKDAARKEKLAAKKIKKVSPVKRKPRASRCSAAPLPLIHCSPARAGVAQVPGRWQGVSGADVDLLIVPLSASARVTAGVGGVTWRSGRLTQG